MKKNDHTLTIRFEDFVESNGLLRPGESVVLAVSGGIDSMVMMNIFCEVQERWNLCLTVAHVNHQLRGAESDGDETFVRESAGTLGLPFTSGSVDTHRRMAEKHCSKQEAARELRYEFLESVRMNVGAHSVATAHQADDNAETVLLNALRGSGIRGMAGIPLRRDSGSIIRPLLFARRSEIEEYARDRQITFRLDSSNESAEYKRNYLRLNVIPVLETASDDGFVTSVNKLSRLMRQLDDMLSAEVRENLPSLLRQNADGSTSLDIPQLRTRPEYLREGIVLEVLRKLKGEVESEKVKGVLDLADRPTGSQLQISGGLHVYRDRDQLNFVRPREEMAFAMQVEPGGTYDLEVGRVTLSAPFSRPEALSHNTGVELIDAERLGKRLVLRTWQDGDWFTPLGMNEKKKLSDFFVDQKVPLLQKQRIPILESDGMIVWICGMRLDDRFKITDQTREVVRLEFTQTPSSH